MVRQVVLLVVACLGILFACRRCSSPAPPAPPPVVPDASSTALASAFPEGASGSPEEATRPPAPRRTGEELVRAAIGRWEAADGGLEVSVDPPHPAPGKRPAYHLIIARAGAVPFGCDFSDPARVPVPGLDGIDGYELTFRAWCGNARSTSGPRDRGAFIGLSLDPAGLHLALTVNGTPKVVSPPLLRRATH